MDYDMACEIHGYLRMASISVQTSGAGREDAGRRHQSALEGARDPIFRGFVVLSVGVAPETHLAEEAGLQLGMKNRFSPTNICELPDENIYAVGDAVCVKLSYPAARPHRTCGPANKQGRVSRCRQHLVDIQQFHRISGVLRHQTVRLMTAAPYRSQRKDGKGGGYHL